MNASIQQKGKFEVDNQEVTWGRWLRETSGTIELPEAFSLSHLPASAAQHLASISCHLSLLKQRHHHLDGPWTVSPSCAAGGGPLVWNSGVSRRKSFLHGTTLILSVLSEEVLAFRNHLLEARPPLTPPGLSLLHYLGVLFSSFIGLGFLCYKMGIGTVSSPS